MTITPEMRQHEQARLLMNWLRRERAAEEKERRRRQQISDTLTMRRRLGELKRP